MVLAGTEVTCCDIVFLVEGTSSCGAYLNEIKANYVVPTVEYFNGGAVGEDKDCGSESFATLYSLVVYHSSDAQPAPYTDCYGPFRNPQKFLQLFDKLDFSGGHAEFLALLAEGLAMTLNCFKDLASLRDPGLVSQKFCILICNSPPYTVPVLDVPNFQGVHLEQLALLVKENGIQLSIISPRRIPTWANLFDKSGGDSSVASLKHYAKDLRHLVLLNGFRLQESEVNWPQVNQPINQSDGLAAQVVQGQSQVNHHDDVPNQQQSQSLAPTSQQQQIKNLAANQFPNQTLQLQTGSDLNQVLHVVNPAPLNDQGTQAIQPQNDQVCDISPQQLQNGKIIHSAVPIQHLAQQIPTAGKVNLSQMMHQINPAPLAGGVQQQQVQPQPQQQLPLAAKLEVPQIVPQTVPAPSLVLSQAQHPPQPVQPVQRAIIWKGILEWQEKTKDPQKMPRQVQCSVSAAVTNSEAEVKAEHWPAKLLMQLIPKTLISNFGGAHFRNARSVMFHPQECEPLETLTKVMSTGYAGCVHFTGMANPQACEIKVLMLLYSPEKKAYIGFIPNDQAGFVDHIRKVIQQQKIKQGQTAAAPAPVVGQNTVTANSGMMVGIQANGVLPQQQQPLLTANVLETERRHNLQTIQQLQKTLEAAQQKELQLKAQEQQHRTQLQQQILVQQPLQMQQQLQLQRQIQHQQIQVQQLQPQRQILIQQQRVIRPARGVQVISGLRQLLQQQQQLRPQQIVMIRQPHQIIRMQSNLQQPVQQQQHAGKTGSYENLSLMDLI